MFVSSGGGSREPGAESAEGRRQLAAGSATAPATRLGRKRWVCGGAGWPGARAPRSSGLAMGDSGSHNPVVETLPSDSVVPSRLLLGSQACLEGVEESNVDSMPRVIALC